VASQKLEVPDSQTETAAAAAEAGRVVAAAAAAAAAVLPAAAGVGQTRHPEKTPLPENRKPTYILLKESIKLGRAYYSNGTWQMAHGTAIAQCSLFEKAYEINLYLYL